MLELICLSNNPKILSFDFHGFERVEGDALEVMRAAKLAVVKGHSLISHPLTGSIRPDVSPYKSIIISKKPGTLDLESLRIIENSIEYTLNLYKTRKNQKWDEDSLLDFQLIDFCLISNYLKDALEKEGNYGAKSWADNDS